MSAESLGVAYVVLPESIAGSGWVSHRLCLCPVERVVGPGISLRTSSDQTAAAADNRSSCAGGHCGRSGGAGGPVACCKALSGRPRLLSRGDGQAAVLGYSAEQGWHHGTDDAALSRGEEIVRSEMP